MDMKGPLAVPGNWISTADGIADHMFLYAICSDEHFCRSVIRQMGQEKYLAYMRYVLGSLYYDRVCPAENRVAMCMASVCAECIKRSNEHGAEPGKQCRDHAYFPKETLPEDECNAFLFRLTDHHSAPDAGYIRIRGRWNERSDNRGSKHIFDCIFGFAAVRADPIC